MAHSLSWYRKGDRYPGSKLYARTWTPDDPNGVSNNQQPIQPLYTNNNTSKSINSPNSSQNHNSNQSSDDFSATGDISDAGAAASIFGSGSGL